MKKSLSMLIILCAFSASAFSQTDQSHSTGSSPSDASMPHSQLPDLQTQMENMKLLMERIRSEQDPKVRERLMQEHMIAMEQSIKIINESMKDNSKMESMSTDKRMDMMNHRMDMMGQMMEQMMEQMNGQMSGNKGMGGGHM